MPLVYFPGYDAKPQCLKQDRIEICDHDSSVELDQVLKDQSTPAISARLD